MPFILSLFIFVPSLVSASCSTFQPLTGTSFTNYTAKGADITISEALICPPTNFTCWVGSSPPIGQYGRIAYDPELIGGIVTVNRTIGISTNADGTDSGMYNTANHLSSDAVSNLFALMSSSTGMTFEQKVVGNLTGQASFELDPGTAAYAVFRPRVECVRGVLRGCSGDGYPQMDTAVEACSPTLPANTCGGPYGCGPNGDFSIVQISTNQTDQVACWPCQVERQLTSAAGKATGGVDMMMVASIAIGVLAWTGW